MGDDWKEKFDFLKKYCDVIIYQEQKEFQRQKLNKI